MKELYSLIIKYCISRCYTYDDLVDKKKLRLHNKAMSQLQKIQKEMYSEHDHCTNIVLELLKHTDERVRMFAATYCLHANILVETGMQVLIQIRDYSESSYMRVSAGQNIDYCVPFE
ncbi:MAG: DUF2019 domain-containing protein [Oscillospiraceae bacterium]|nr:DUF2019 domain-containing protein [Oscillospiraceae bacterium]